jgi:hypothetical protein
VNQATKIRNQILKSLVISLALNSIHAQTSNFEIGVSGGPNSSPFTEKKPDQTHSDVQPKYAAYLEVSFQWNTTDHLSLRSGIAYQQNKYSFETNYLDAGTCQSSNGTGKDHFEYVTLPILARLTFGQKLQFFFNTGGSISFLTKQSESYKGTQTVVTGGNSQTTTFESEGSNLSDYKKFNFGLSGGIGFGVPIEKRWNLSLELRSYFGLSNILHENYYKRIARSNSLNLLLGVSYKFGFHEK